MVKLSPEELEALRKFNSPTISNAIEAFDIRPRNTGFMDPTIKCVFPDMGVMVGYACTGKMEASKPAAPEHAGLQQASWDHILSISAPRVMVLEDIDEVPVGSYWGEVNASIHKALGCVGVVTNGGVRDLDEVKALGFQYFASTILVSHAYVHLVEVGRPVKVGGLTVNPGDLIHADKHGVVIIPDEIAKDLAEVAKRVEAAERPVIDYCKSPNIDVSKLRELVAQMREDRKKAWPK